MWGQDRAGLTAGQQWAGQVLTSMHAECEPRHPPPAAQTPTSEGTKKEERGKLDYLKPGTSVHQKTQQRLQPTDSWNCEGSCPGFSHQKVKGSGGCLPQQLGCHTTHTPNHCLGSVPSSWPERSSTANPGGQRRRLRQAVPAPLAAPTSVQPAPAAAI